MSDSNTDLLTDLLESWSRDESEDKVIEILTKIAELMEKETEIYLKMDPDPFDERHPCRIKPNSNFGTLLKSLFKNENFMHKLVNQYLMNRDNKQMQITACRLAVDILPGLETSVVFSETEGLLEQVYRWVEKEDDPLQSYAIGLLAEAMELQEITTQNKDKNAKLIPMVLQKLTKLIEEKHDNDDDDQYDSSNENLESATKRRRISSPINECSNSSWADMETYLIGSSKIYPLVNEMSQRFCYQFLAKMGEYQEFLSYVFEHNALHLILRSINLRKNRDIRLALDALKYLASLICHKKFALEFVNSGALKSLLDVYQHSLAACGVSLCFCFISYHDDVMEKICSLSTNMLTSLVSYNLFLIEKSYDSSRSNAMIFFSQSLSYQNILYLFDKLDGLGKIISQMSITNLNPARFYFSEEETFIKRYYAKHICLALRRYFETHLVLKAQNIIKSIPNIHCDNFNQYARLRDIEWSPNKPINNDYDLMTDYVEALLQLMPSQCQWPPVDLFIKKEGPKLLIQYISYSIEWNSIGKVDALRSALGILVVCSVLPKFQQVLITPIEIEHVPQILGMRLVLAVAGGELISDPECQKSALNIIINCVCGPINHRFGSKHLINLHRKKIGRYADDLRCKLWNCVRFNNGIMLLMNLLMTKTPVTEADSIRTLSCKALCGLARSDSVREVICKFPLFTDGQIQTLMKEPVLQDNRKEHLKFSKYCLELIKMVVGSPGENILETSISNINKNEVITQTKIVYKEKELLKLIYNHLMDKGLEKTAKILSEEANLTESESSAVCLINKSSSSKMVTPSKNFSLRLPRQLSINSPSPAHLSSPLIKSSNSPSVLKANSRLPVRLNLKNPNSKKKNDVSNQSTIVSLDSIVTEYLRKQHASCKNPVMTCPPFDLFKPHRCPEPTNKNLAPYNITLRLIRKQYYPSTGGHNGSRFDRKFLYSRFRFCRSVRCFEPTVLWNCAFGHNSNFLYVGSENGDLYVFNYETCEMENTYSCYESLISYIEPSRDNAFILTTTFWEQPHSILWKFEDNNLEEVYTFAEDNHIEFGKMCQDKVIGTRDYAANLYDLNALKLVRKFEDENYSNKYIKNMATFHPDDFLILNDGVLWDVRQKYPLHKFDKFNEIINGIFHPNGLEIVSSSEIWDLKTKKLLKTVPALSQSRIKFNDQGKVIYAIYEDEKHTIDPDCKVAYSSSFRTFDGIDYSSIATIDVKRSIYALATNPNDRYIALIESNRETNLHFPHENMARVYEVGRCRDEDEDERPDEEDEDAENEETDEEVDQLDSDSLSPSNYSDSEAFSLILEDSSDITSDDDGTDDNSDNDDDDDDDDDDDSDGIFYQLNN